MSSYNNQKSQYNYDNNFQSNNMRGYNLSQKELHKTQVLNLNDVLENVKMERFTSMKPGIIIAFLGIILLVCGTIFQYKVSLNAKKAEEKVVLKRQEMRKELTSKSSVLSCKKSSINNQDGTNTVYSINYQFVEDKLISFTKSFDVTSLDNNELGMQTVNSYLTAYQSFMNQTEGYTISVIPKESGLTTTVEVDLQRLDINNLNPTQQTHFSTSVDYPKDTSRNAILQTDMNINGLICE